MKRRGMELFDDDDSEYNGTEAREWARTIARKAREYRKECRFKKLSGRTFVNEGVGEKTDRRERQ